MKISAKMITRTALILALAMAIQSVRLPQFVTGPAINTLLLIATAMVGMTSGLIVGILTPFLAFVFGIMPLAPVVPLIMVANATLVIVFGLFKERYIYGILSAAVLKYAVLALGVKYVIPVLFGIKLPPKIIVALTTPQLFTALTGGAVAYIILKGLQVMKKQQDLDTI